MLGTTKSRICTHYKCKSKVTKTNASQSIIDSDVVNDPYSAANTAVPAEFASRLAVERIICNAGRNRIV